MVGTHPCTVLNKWENAEEENKKKKGFLCETYHDLSTRGAAASSSAFITVTRGWLT